MIRAAILRWIPVLAAGLALAGLVPSGAHAVDKEAVSAAWSPNEDDSWLFVTVKADQLPSLRPLITVWLDIAISAIMSLTPDRNRRLYCVIDELPTLQKLHLQKCGATLHVVC